ncbi:dynein light chain Tctex-type protein 2B-like [Venturia canescens]|uniref:dynein light chain Tctex-type protein 2B-like n=1 Tax=Venturia canescens TaxID=32260 RepID=UPI001C9CD2AF|nr:dynein light chain Tctex-type protein 2B-like [Venturia canescens]
MMEREDEEVKPLANETDEGDSEGKKKSNLDLEITDEHNEDELTSASVYQIRPRLNEKFKPLSVKEVIHNVLFDQLSAKTYSSEDASAWSKGIADTIKTKVKELQFKRYKYIVNVVLGEQKGAGLKIGTRCIWDAEADSYAYDNFVNDTIFCVASVYAVYYY